MNVNMYTSRNPGVGGGGKGALPLTSHLFAKFSMYVTVTKNLWFFQFVFFSGVFFGQEFLISLASAPFQFASDDTDM